MSAQVVLPAIHSINITHQMRNDRLPSIFDTFVERSAIRAGLEATAAAVLQEANKQASPRYEHHAIPRTDPGMLSSPYSRPSTGLKLRTRSTSLSETGVHQHGTTLANSPSLYRHVIQRDEGMPDRLPAVSPPAVTSPQSQQLPSIRHLQLSELAEVATQQDTRAPPQISPTHRQHSHSLSSATSRSSSNPFFTFSNNNNDNNNNNNINGHASSMPYPLRRTSSIGDSSQPFSTPNYNPDRRASAATGTDSHRNYSAGSHSFRIGSLSEESAQHDSHMDDYSASQTPVDGMMSNMENSSRLLPPLPGMMSYKCDHDGCSATFQTQYLLSSHKNVHSSVRTHFCPVKGCLRSEGGKGFKRKNEMIRHGLVHKSPGYICPFCPDIERKYPRPDNLQRHVRVHHVDRDRDDPALREVLAQRTEGALRVNRRRRTLATINLQHRPDDSC
ncbi:uncharacterized protein K489DRAFT_29270 [Dissoconium aciculare CBS 342.82]|uniref:C2H2-type domain-containing protein n=1 Tax=Dissoconium aciculare CBS 342.82 TaxID=1314786 RepID=A0A6J3MIT3_9PEZI|nr:uncharacterized protein K489DRAFT_29270 [Dissoconium aciculare CBS 342.82]KAF1827831.1 hypothetical protein K489DRAFT_29270 [Dissoconium aciculare CBS 342.82]